MLNIPIVVVAFNRKTPLERLLKSLNKAEYSQNVDLIFSIDHGDNKDVLDIAKNFTWQFGDKKVIYHDTNLGLRSNILFCGDLTTKYDGVIILEDDLYVSPFFYSYTIEAVNYYQNDPNITGISLYSHYFNETSSLPFIPLQDHTDIYFLQLASSWGQCWTRRHWQEFKQWYKGKNQNYIENLPIPKDIIEWPESSWKKYFIAYMIETDKFFVYPRLSLTTNFCEQGTHSDVKRHTFQTQLQYFKKNYVFQSLLQSSAVYDSYCELLPDRLNRLFPTLKKYSYEIDLYGTKPLKMIKNKYLLSTKKSTDSIFQYGREMKPIEINVMEEVAGEEIYFGEKTTFHEEGWGDMSYSSQDFYYYFNLLDYNLKIDNLKKYCAELMEDNKNIKNSWTMRIGRILLFPVIQIKKLVAYITSP
jgi:glycosyl transferase family 2